MTTPEKLARDIRRFDPQMTGGCSCGPHTFTEIADAIDALIKERDTVAKWRDIFDKQASGLFMECWEQKTNNRILARENERLLQRIEDLRAAVKKAGCTCGGLLHEHRDTCDEIIMFDALEADDRAALANAPTPNDKGK